MMVRPLTKMDGRPLTDHERQIAAKGWRVAAKVVMKLFQKNRIHVHEIDDALDTASRTLVSAAKRWNPALSELSTYVWASTARNVMREIYEGRVQQTRSAARYLDVHQHANRDSDRVRGIIDRRQTGDEEAASTEACQGIWALIDELIAIDPENGAILKRKALGESDETIGRSLGISRQAVHERLGRAKGWLAVKLQMRPDGLPYELGYIVWSNLQGETPVKRQPRRDKGVKRKPQAVSA